MITQAIRNIAGLLSIPTYKYRTLDTDFICDIIGDHADSYSLQDVIAEIGRIAAIMQLTYIRDGASPEYISQLFHDSMEREMKRGLKILEEKGPEACR